MSPPEAQPPPTPSRQLALPLLLTEPPPPVLPPDLAAFYPPQIWATLTPTAQAQVRTTVRHIIQEVLNECHDL